MAPVLVRLLHIPRTHGHVQVHVCTGGRSGTLYPLTLNLNLLMSSDITMLVFELPPMPSIELVPVSPSSCDTL